MAQKIKVGAVSYLNTKPLIYGFQQGMMLEEIDLIIDYPANIAEKLRTGIIDIGLVPVTLIPVLEEKYIISEYCIGSKGEVASVCLFSDVPLEEIKTILLDYQSNTSVALLKILLQLHWKITPDVIIAAPGYEKNITGMTAGLVIGDRAFEQRKKSAYIYDLGLAWNEMTGLPFVFAAWVSNKKITPGFENDFNDANAAGLTQIEKVINENPYAVYDLNKYYTNIISYKLEEDKREGLALFLSMIS